MDPPGADPPGRLLGAQPPVFPDLTGGHAAAIENGGIGGSQAGAASLRVPG
jgi:hypothetical protein